MRVAELSERAGVPVPTIKYYLREGLLPRGERTSPNQAQYDETHERRLRLVRALTEVGGLSIAATRDVLAYVDEPGPTVNQMLGRTMSAVTTADVGATPADREAAEAVVDDLIERRGWPVEADYPARQSLIEVVAALRGVDRGVMLEELDRYAEAAESIASTDLDVVGKLTDVDAILETAVVGTVLGDVMIAALRRLAQIKESLSRYGSQ